MGLVSSNTHDPNVEYRDANGKLSQVVALHPETVQALAGGGTGGASGVTFTPTNGSGTITTGGTAQQLFAADVGRRGWWIQNQSSGDLWLNELDGTAAAVQPSFRLAAGALYESPVGTSGAISVFGATTGQAFAARSF